MQAFFSGTDDAALESEGLKMNHYVSLVVNNSGPYVARITTRVNDVQSVNHTFNYSTFNGKNLALKNNIDTEKREVHYVVYNDLIVVNQPIPKANALEAEISDRIEELELISKQASALVSTRPLYEPKYGASPFDKRTIKPKYAERNGYDYEEEANYYNDEYPGWGETKGTDNINFDRVYIKEPILAKKAAQLFTLNILADESTIDLSDFINNKMEGLFDDAFIDIKSFSDFFSSYAESILAVDNEIIDRAKTDYKEIIDDPDGVAVSALANELLDFIASKNKYTDKMKEILYEYIN